MSLYLEVSFLGKDTLQLLFYSTHHSSHLDTALTAVLLGLSTGGLSTALDVILGLGVDHLAHEIGHGVEHLGKELEHGVDHLAHEISHGAQHLAHEIGHGVDHLAHEIGHGAEHLGHEIGHGVEHLGHEIEHGVSHIGHELHRMYWFLYYMVYMNRQVLILEWLAIKECGSTCGQHFTGLFSANHYGQGQFHVYACGARSSTWLSKAASTSIQHKIKTWLYGHKSGSERMSSFICQNVNFKGITEIRSCHDAWWFLWFLYLFL